MAIFRTSSWPQMRVRRLLPLKVPNEASMAREVAEYSSDDSDVLAYDCDCSDEYSAASSPGLDRRHSISDLDTSVVNERNFSRSSSSDSPSISNHNHCKVCVYQFRNRCKFGSSCVYCHDEVHAVRWQARKKRFSARRKGKRERMEAKETEGSIADVEPALMYAQAGLGHLLRSSGM
jgi:hypothetical protein